MIHKPRCHRSGLLPHRPGRAHPYLYSNDEVRKLLQAARQLPSDAWPARSDLLLPVGVAGRGGPAYQRSTQPANRRCGSEGRCSHHSRSQVWQVPVWYPFILLPVKCSQTMRRGGIVFWHDGRRPSSYLAVGLGWTAPRSGARFTLLSRQIGLRGPSDSHGPRLHDFRHRFAVETLVQWYRSGQDVERRLPVLSTYLGMFTWPTPTGT